MGQRRGGCCALVCTSATQSAECRCCCGVCVRGIAGAAGFRGVCGHVVHHRLAPALIATMKPPAPDARAGPTAAGGVFPPDRSNSLNQTLRKVTGCAKSSPGSPLPIRSSFLPLDPSPLHTLHALLSYNCVSCCSTWFSFLPSLRVIVPLFGTLA